MADDKSTRNENNRTRVIALCRSCGVEFYPVLTAVRRGRGVFCSPSCAGRGVMERRMAGRPPRPKAVPRAPFVDRFWAAVDKTNADGCWEWTRARFPSGYGKMQLEGGSRKVPGSRKLEGAHRLAWTLTHGEIPDGLWVLHKCDNRPCCRPDHLFLGTCADNVRDMVAKGRHRFTANRLVSFSREQLTAFVAMRDAGVTLRVIAEVFSASRRSVARALRRMPL
jgi:hypothetical protein